MVLKTWHCSHLLLTAVLLWIWIARQPHVLQMRCSATDRYYLPMGPTAANPVHTAAARKWDRRTDVGRRSIRQTLLHTVWAVSINQHTHTRLMSLCPGLPRWAGTTKVKPIWTLLKQETVSGSGISCAICKSALCSRQKNHTSTPPLSFL